MSARKKSERILDSRKHLLILLVLILITVFVYLPIRKYGFFYFDDHVYISENPNVKGGLTGNAIAWALTAYHACNWHPITWMSHMLDVQLYGLNPGAHHLTNLLFHILNTSLLFFVFRKMTGALWQSTFIAVLFAVHPLHVESVVWIAERKDVLSTFFWLLAMLSYTWYAKRTGSLQYMATLILFIFGLMSKPMVVTFPLVLLLLDFWPLGRFHFGDSSKKLIFIGWDQNSRLIWEKVPFFVLSGISSVITVLAQRAGDAIQSLDRFSILLRIENALVAYASYIGKMIWPNNLAFLYPYPRHIPLWQTTGALLLLTSLSIITIRYAKRLPYLSVGWFWYIGTLIPVIGLVQVGVQAMADRYTYIPLIGLFIAAAWGIPDLLSKWRFKKTVIIVFGIIVVSVLMVKTLIQIQYWKDSIPLFRHTLSVTKNNYKIHISLANDLLKRNHLDEAIDQYRIALQIKPDFAEAHNNLGVALEHKNEFSQAIVHYLDAIRIYPKYVEAHNNLGAVLLQVGRTGEAIKYYRKSLLYNYDNAETHNNIGLALLRQGRIDRAVHHFQQAILLDQYNSATHRNFKLAVSLQQKIDRCLNDLSKALNINPEKMERTGHINSLIKNKKEFDSIVQQYTKSLSRQPGFKPAELNIENYPKASKVMKLYNKLLPAYKQMGKDAFEGPEISLDIS